MSRCIRCDSLAPGEHRCPHDKLCLAFYVVSHCAECKAFKERQEPLFDAADGIEAKPFLKWAGGKRQLVPQLMKHVPSYSGRYFEPFLGGGAMFFALKPESAVLADTNSRLVRTYRGVGDSVEAVIHGLSGYPLSKDFFLTMRGKPIDSTSDVEVACWLLYLNRTAFNGLYRVNKSGGFNVPWGKYKNPTICDEKALRAASLMLRRAELRCADFEEVAESAQEGDLVYFDPPYVPASSTANFTSYTQDKFGLNNQIRLRDCAIRLKQRGVHVMLTNSNTATVRELYADFDSHRLQARGSVAASKKSRGKRIDLLVT
jgi:DNA adenine methylase